MTYQSYFRCMEPKCCEDIIFKQDLKTRSNRTRLKLKDKSFHVDFILEKPECLASAAEQVVSFKSTIRTTTEQLRLGTTVWPLGSQTSVEISVFAWLACPCLFLAIIQLSVEQHLSSCLCVAGLFMVLKATEERTC